MGPKWGVKGRLGLPPASNWMSGRTANGSPTVGTVQLYPALWLRQAHARSVAKVSAGSLVVDGVFVAQLIGEERLSPYGLYEEYEGSFRDHILPTPGGPQVLQAVPWVIGSRGPQLLAKCLEEVPQLMPWILRYGTR